MLQIAAKRSYLMRGVTLKPYIIKIQLEGQCSIGKNHKPCLHHHVSKLVLILSLLFLRYNLHQGYFKVL